MPLSTGPNSIRTNVSELMSSIKSPARKKAVATIAKNRNVSRKEAQFLQALAISTKMARK